MLISDYIYKYRLSSNTNQKLTKSINNIYSNYSEDVVEDECNIVFENYTVMNLMIQTRTLKYLYLTHVSLI